MTLPFIYLFTVFVVNVLYFVTLNPVLKFLPDPELYSNLFINAVFFGLIMGLQDRLYELWRKDYLFFKMLLLIVSGSIVTFLTNYYIYMGSPGVNYALGVCGFAAFGLSRLIDFLVFHFFRKCSLSASITFSKFISGLLDPIIFFATSTLFGYYWDGAIPLFLSLVIGGIIWSYLLIKGRVLG
jgi:uncharacterized PurR-regulated membrane protein YhhQ (DUF165 family)